MTSQPEIVGYPDREELARQVADRLVRRLALVQAQRGEATLVLTGGGIAAAVYRAVGTHPAVRSVNWGRVNLWWGDERFLPAGDPDRNETQARQALLDALPLARERVHPMPASDGPDGDDAAAAARRYASELRAAAGSSGQVPSFDVLLLGIGPDGHVASLFPGQETGGESPDQVTREESPGQETAAESRLVIPVLDSPKPPPVRISLTLPAINTATEIWLVVSGSSKAEAVRRALAGDAAVPAAGVAAAGRTVWFLDSPASAPQPGGA